MNVFKKIKEEVASQLANPPKIETEESWNLGVHFQSDFDEEDQDEFDTYWIGDAGGIFTREIEGKEFWFRLVREGEEQ